MKLSQIHEDDYRGHHTAPGPEDNCPLYNLTANDIYPRDVYTKPRWYNRSPEETAAWNIAVKVRNKPDAIVTIYRAVPPDQNITKINNGDWVTISKDYAVQHGESVLKGKFKILSLKTKAKNLFTEGNSLAEWGFYEEPAQTLREWTDSPFDYEISHTSPKLYTGKFTDDAGILYVVYCSLYSQTSFAGKVACMTVDFERWVKGKNTIKQTNDSKQPIKVFSTVANIVKDVCDKVEGLGLVEFSADKSEPGRVTLYRKIANMLSKRVPTLSKIGEMGDHREHTFMVYNPRKLADHFWDDDLDETVAGNIATNGTQLFKKGMLAPRIKESDDPEVADAKKYARKHYASDSPQDAFDKYVIRSLHHAEEDDKKQDAEIQSLAKDVEKLMKEFEQFKKDNK